MLWLKAQAPPSGASASVCPVGQVRNKNMIGMGKLHHTHHHTISGFLVAMVSPI